MIHFVDPMDSLLSVLAAPYERLADSLAIVTRVQSELLNTDKRFDVKALIGFLALVSPFAILYLNNRNTKRKEKVKERERILELWNFIENWTAQIIESFDEFLDLARKHKDSFSDIANDLVLQKIVVDVSLITNIDQPDLYSVFISKRKKKDNIFNIIFYDFIFRLRNLKMLNEDYVTSLSMVSEKINGMEKELNDVNDSLESTEQRLFSTIKELEQKVVKGFPDEDTSLSDYYTKLVAFWNCYLRIKQSGDVVNSESTDKVITDLLDVIDKTFPVIKNNLYFLKVQLEKQLRAKRKLDEYYKRRTSQGNDLVSDIENHLSILGESLGRFNVKENPFLGLEEF